MQKYTVNHQTVDDLLSWVKQGIIAIPEIQRPFVWDSTKVRDLIDSLYSGFPIGYLIIWKNPDIKLKDGTVAEGKKILIDGQQRVTALMTSILGETVLNKDYEKKKITIAFNPLSERFEVLNPAIVKDVTWIPDISVIFPPDASIRQIVNDYCTKNPTERPEEIDRIIQKVKNIQVASLGLIELSADLDIEVVTEIFIRVNSEGEPLKQADFTMSKIASTEKYDGSNIRKCIDYFCNLAVSPEFYEKLVENDTDFTKTEYFTQISWLKGEKDDLYDPDYTDLLRVASLAEFERGRMKDIVSLLSGRNFETRAYEEDIRKKSFSVLKKGLLDFINETNFKRFCMIIKSAGFISSRLIRSKSVLDFAYALYLKLKAEGYHSADIESLVRRWLVMSILNKRYSGSPESQFDFDIKRVVKGKCASFLEEIENADLSDAFWESSLTQSLDSSVASSPFFNVFIAAQVKRRDKGFLSSDITVHDLIEHRGDIHHIFPKNYLVKSGLTRGKYNQIANYAYMQSEINIRIGDIAPKEYFASIRKQISKQQPDYGGIQDEDELKRNLRMNCIPESIFDMTIDDYEEFLFERRALMAKKIRKYYKSL